MGRGISQGRARQDAPEPLEDVHTLEETKGCAILDSGATVMCSSTAAAEEIQLQRLRQHELGDPKALGSDRCCKFVDGRTDEAQKMVEQPITAGLLKGNPICKENKEYKSLKKEILDKTL